MKLLLDAGNRACKWGLQSEHGELVETGQLQYHDMSVLPACFEQANKIFLANVAGDKALTSVQSISANLAIPLQVLQVGSQYQGLQNRYAQPAQLGIDRWCAAVATWQLMTEQGVSACLVVNAGSAITVDSVEQQAFLGGLILPGVGLQAEALSKLAFAQPAQNHHHQMVDKADKMGWSGQLVAMPNNSADACFSGVMRAILGAISWQYAQLKANSGGQVLCVLSGGDAELLAPKLAEYGISATLQAHLVLKGINLLSQ